MRTTPIFSAKASSQNIELAAISQRGSSQHVSKRKREAEHPGSQMAAAFRKGLGETGLLIVVLALLKPLSPPGDLSGQLICGPIET